jgi:hypothetical protein
MDFTIDLLVPARNSYSVGEAPQLWARVLNTGSAAIDAYDLEGRFSVISPSGVAIDAGMGWNSMSMQTGAISVIENTDNAWTIPNGAEAGTYTLRVTINSRSTGVAHSGQLDNAFSVNAPPAADFTLSISPGSQTVTAGQSTTFTVSVNPQNGWTAPVSLQVSGLPSDSTSNFDPNPVQSGGFSTLSVSTSRSTGQFGLVVVGNGEGRQHTTSATLIIQPSQQGQLDFSIDLLVPAKNSYEIGETPELWARVLNSGSVTIGAYDLGGQFSVISPSGVTIAAGGGQNGYDIPSGGVHVLENTDNPWTIPSNAEPGLYALRVIINSRSSGLSRSQQLDSAFSISAPPACDFTLSISPTSQLVNAGQQTEFTVTVNSPCGWSEPVSLDVSGLPSDATGAFSSNPVMSAQSSTLSIGTSGTTTGQFHIVILGNSGGRQHTTAATLIIQSNQPGGFEFSISASESSATIEVGKAADVCTVNVELISGSPGRVDLFLTGLPSNIGTYAFSPPYDDTPFTSTLSIGIFDGATPGVYSLTITGSGGGKTHSTTITLTVTAKAGFDFSISVSPSSGSVGAGNVLSRAGTVSLSLVSGSTQSVSLSVSGLPSSVGTEDLTGKSCSPDCQIEFGIGTYSGASPGTYALTITGSGGGKVHSTIFALNVNAPGPQPSAVNAAIVDYSIPSGQFKAGESVRALVTVQNTGNSEWTFYVGYSVQDPNGKWWDAPYCTVILSVGQSGQEPLVWNVPDSSPVGQYNGRVAVYKGKSSGGLVDRLDVRDKLLAFVRAPSEEQLHRVIEDIRPFIDVLTNEATVKLMLEEAQKGATKFDLAFNVSPEASEALGQTARTLQIAVNVVYLGSLVKSNDPVNTKVDSLQKFMGGATKDAVVEIACLVALGVATAPAGGAGALACGLVTATTAFAASTLLSYWNDKLDKLIGSVWTTIFDWLLYLYKRIFKAEGGSSIGLMVVDPSGRRVGALMQNGQWMAEQEIPNAYYSGLGSHPQYIAIPEPGDGSYRVVVTGNQTGEYHLNTTLSVDAVVVSEQTLGGNVGEGATQEHQVLLVLEERRAIVDPSPMTVLWYREKLPIIAAIVASLIIGALFALRRRESRRRPRVLSASQRVLPSPLPEKARITETDKPRIIEIKQIEEFEKRR